MLSLCMTKYEEIARNEASKYYDYPGLLGILWVGSSSFGIEDEMADIDLRILISGRSKSRPMQQYKISNILIEVDEMRLDWLLNNTGPDSEQAWIIEKSIVLYDPDNKVVVALDKARKKLSKTDNKKLLWDNYCLLYSHYDLEKSLKRDQTITSHIILSNILDALSKFIFLYQNKAVPPQKWRWYMIRKDKLFDMDNVDKLTRLNLPNSGEEMVLLIKEIQKEYQKIMLDLGFEKEKVMEPWRF